MPKFDEEKQNKQLEELHKKEEEDLAQMLSQKYSIPYLDLSLIAINTDALRIILEPVARAAHIAAFKLIGQQIHIATSKPEKEEAIMVFKELERQSYRPFLYMVSEKSLNRAWERYKEISYATETQAGILDISNNDVGKYLNDFKNVKDITAALTDAVSGKGKFQTSRIIEILVAGALATDASDIHIEPQEHETELRLRLDGVLQKLFSFEQKIYNLILSRVKLLSGLKLNIKQNSQDGRFSIKLKDIEIEIRTSVIPGAYGESIVMRVLNPNTIGIPVEELGLEPDLHKILEHEIERPNGMLLNTGPTGSGKTTTLYAFLKKIKTPEIKIITIEDPIEYHLPGIVQTQTDDEKGYTFLQGLVSSLRQDPDVIMVGEIREEETAKTAIHAALTGHLVFSTLHTNNAAGTIPRLIDLGVNPKIISSALNIAIAQRLVRKLCVFCKKEEVPTPEEKKQIEEILKTIQKKIGPVDTGKVWRPVGCEKCNKTGYKGRIGIFEAILINKKIEDLMAQNPSEREIKIASLDQGILDMRQDGVLKVLQGITDLEELRRVIDLEAKD